MPKLTPRLATEADRDSLLEWRNDPAARASSFTTHEISPDEHYAWFAAKLADPNCTLLVFEDENHKSVAQVRFDLREDEAAEVAITVAPSAQGRGVGTGALRQAAEYARRHSVANRLHAQVKEDNPASSRAFVSAGFEQVAVVDGVGQYELQLSGPRRVGDEPSRQA